MEGSTGLNNMGSDTLIKLAGPRNVIKGAEVKLILKYRVTRVVGFGQDHHHHGSNSNPVNQFDVISAWLDVSSSVGATGKETLSEKIPILN